MKILYAASEAAPFAKSGGLADVAGALPKALVRDGIDARVVMPLYGDLKPEGMAKIRLIASGICGTDVHIYKGKIPVNMPAIIGHEFIGEVEALSASDSKQYGIQAGDRVIVDIACPCGH